MDSSVRPENGLILIEDKRCIGWYVTAGIHDSKCEYDIYKHISRIVLLTLFIKTLYRE